MNILVTGGAGYIGSHTVHQLREAGISLTVFDNLSKGHKEAVPPGVPLVVGDLRDGDLLRKVLRNHEIRSVVHFAASSLVGESMQKPAEYYSNNVAGTLSLLEAMRETRVGEIVFSSTAAVYGEPEVCPITEEQTKAPTNVYGRTKLMIEEILKDYDMAYGLRYVSLRYFNAAGAVDGGIIGEDHQPESHLIPLILQTALGRRPTIDIYGNDYPTQDGTCIRDYIHVLDLADAHVLAVRHLAAGGNSRCYNLGSERGFSVREVVETAKKVTSVDFAVRESERRVGDPAILVASSARIREELGWNPSRSGLETIITAAWEWHSKHPDGYSSAR